MEYRARNDFLVERPQILKRASAAAHDQDIDFAPSVGERDCAGNFRGCRIALHRRRIDDDSRCGRAAAKGCQHVG